MPPSYRYLVGDLNPASGNGLREEIPFSTVKFSQVLNRAGGFSATLPLRHGKATRGNLDPARTAVHVERDGVIAWSGIIWAVRAGVADETVEIAGEGWWSYFRRRLVKAGVGGPSPSTATSRIYLAKDQLFVARDLLNYAQSQNGGNVGVVVGTELTTDNGGVQQLRDRTYEAYSRHVVADAVEELAGLARGFDFAVDTAYESGTIVKRLRFGYPRRGRITPLVWELGTNLEDVGVDVDGTRQANDVTGIGHGEGDTMLITTRSATADLGTWPLLETVATAKTIDVAANLGAFTDTVLRARRRPVTRLPALLARQSNPDTTLGTFIVGDSVVVKASDGWVDLDTRMRIQGYDVSIDEDGREKVAVGFAEEEASV